MAETKKTSSTKKPTTKKTTTKSTPSKTTSKKTTTRKKPSTTTKVKPLPKEEVKPKKKTKKTPKPKVLASESVVKKQAVTKTLEKKDKPVKKRGKTFYLIFSIIVFVAAFFYINNIVYDNNSWIESAVFAFMILFVTFLLLQFNIHMIFINFFRLPFKYLIEEAKLSIEKEVIVDKRRKNIFARSFGKYRAIFTLALYIIIFLLLVGSQVYAGILDGDKILLIITQSGFTGLVFVIIICSWQYLFNIIPNILEKSIDAKNGFILTLSAFAMIIYVVFIVFDITFLAETMIFILIIGFVALLGVNLNMIVGEINIFSNLRDKKNKTVARIVFLIFFGFHLYVILYASVIAFSIYRWNPEAYNTVNTPYDDTIYEDVQYLDQTDFTWKNLETVYDFQGNEISVVYDKFGDEITKFTDTNGNVIDKVYDEEGTQHYDFYVLVDDGLGGTTTQMIHELQSGDEVFYPNEFAFMDGTLVGYHRKEVPHSYGDFLYYTVVTVSTLGYGDITPNTNFTMAKSWGAFLGIYGVTFYALSIGFVSNIAIEGATERKED